MLCATIGMPSDSTVMKVSGTVKSSLIVATSSSVVMTVEVSTKLPGLTRRSPTRPANGALTCVFRSRAFCASTFASLTLTWASSVSRLDSEIACVEVKFLAAIVETQALRKRRFGLRQFSLDLAVFELDEQVSLRDDLAFFEEQSG